MNGGEQTPRILSIGEAMLELSAAGQDDLWRLGIAGDTLNTAWYLRRLLGQGARVDYFTRVGTGEFSQKMLDFLTAEGIGTDHIARDPGREIGLYAISLKNGERSFSYWRDSSAAKLLADDPAALDRALAGAGIAYFSGISVAILSDRGRANLRDALARARDQGTMVIFDPNLRPQLWKDEKEMVRTLNSLAQEADLVLPGLSEGKILTKRDTPEGIAEFYHERGVDSVIVKLGDKGAYWSTGGEHGTVPAFPVKRIVDTVGAGDGLHQRVRLQRLVEIQRRQ